MFKLNMFPLIDTFWHRVIYGVESWNGVVEWSGVEWSLEWSGVYIIFV